ncbi:hypothetical protein EI94DRAFT_1707713 [Lactarius quietus]|nr:hypothetical protein EI94DRAFT_1707713 [Lactarius quietus]
MCPHYVGLLAGEGPLRPVAGPPRSGPSTAFNGNPQVAAITCLVPMVDPTPDADGGAVHTSCQSLTREGKTTKDDHRGILSILHSNSDPMTDFFSITEFLDLEAAVDNEEEEEDYDDDDELARFFDDDDPEEEMDWDWPRSLTPSDLHDEAAEMRARAAARRAALSPMPEVPEEVPHHLLLPAEGNPEMWAVRIKPERESDLVYQIATLCLTGNPSRQPNIASVFARPGILGWIFIEGQPIDVTGAVHSLVTVYREQWLVPPEQHLTLLSRRSPLSRTIREGEWVRCLHGLYRGDIGLVCGHNGHSNNEVIVAFVPRIPEKASGSKRKRLASPEPQKWTSDQVKAVWGKKTYKSGLVLKHLPTASVALLTSTPSDIDSIKVGQRVKVLSGEQQGIVGHPKDISNGVATVVLQTDNQDTPPLLISLRELTLVYLPGDHVKSRYFDSKGIVSSVDETNSMVTMVERNTNAEYNAHMHAIEPCPPAPNFYRFKPGLWVNFSGPKDSEQPKRRSCITVVEDTHALVIDERTFTEFKIDTSDLEVAALQAASLPAHDLVHPLVGRRVVVTQGSRRGYDGVVKDVRNMSVTVKLDALFAGSALPLQSFAWHHLRQMYICYTSAEEEITKTNPGHRQATPPPDPDGDHPRASTPEPEGSHWIFTSKIQSIIEWKTIPFFIRNTHESNDHSLQIYEKSTGRTVPMDRRTATPEEGKVTLSVVKRSRAKQISVHPRFLVPWGPVVGCEVLVTKGRWFGMPGVAKEERSDGQWLVRFNADDTHLDSVFDKKDHAVLEAIR